MSTFKLITRWDKARRERHDILHRGLGSEKSRQEIRALGEQPDPDKLQEIVNKEAKAFFYASHVTYELKLNCDICSARVDSVVVVGLPAHTPTHEWSVCGKCILHMFKVLEGEDDAK